ncbi:MAG: class E sortase [Rubrobacteraceae bacterium]
MRTYRSGRPLKTVARLLALVLVLVGIGLVGYTLLIRDPLATSALSSTGPPQDATMTLTVPEMSRVNELPIYDGPATDTAALRDGALHVNETGFPWQTGSNVYIAGHRLGFPGTKSYLVFWDLNKLENGDEIILTDANGTNYTYSVFDEFVVDPGAGEVLQPVPGRSIVSLQTCTLPDYSQRLIVQAELTSVA